MWEIPRCRQKIMIFRLPVTVHAMKMQFHTEISPTLFEYAKVFSDDLCFETVRC